jgi:hypothetical protein
VHIQKVGRKLKRSGGFPPRASCNQKLSPIFKMKYEGDYIDAIKEGQNIYLSSPSNYICRTLFRE